MKKVAILTDFVSHDPAYSLCGVVLNQVKMLAMNGYEKRFEPVVIVRDAFPLEQTDVYQGCDVVGIDPGGIGSNIVEVTEKSEEEIKHIEYQLRNILFPEQPIDVVLTHDIIYQANAWKYHVAIRRLAKQYPNIHWLHWVHSASPWSVAEKTEQFKDELTGIIPNSKLVVMNAEEVQRKAGAFGYEIDQVVLIPNPFDPAAYYTEEAKEILNRSNAWLADVVGIYPVRLDRGKQVEVPIEIFAGLVKHGLDVRLIVVDFHSTGGEKVTYRLELKQKALELGVPIFFTSDLGGDKPLYTVEHKTVMDLYDFADVFIHPSRSECDPLTLPEAMWNRNLLMLNFDLPMFRLYEEFALMGKFGSNIDVVSGQAGSTDTSYSNRQDYMDEMGMKIAYMLENNKALKGHREVRLKRSLYAIWKNNLGPAIEGA